MNANTVMEIQIKNIDEEVSSRLMLIESSKEKIKEKSNEIESDLLSDSEYKDQSDAKEYAQKRMKDIKKIKKDSEPELSDKMQQVKIMKKDMKKYKKELKELIKEAASKGRVSIAGKQLIVQYQLF